MASSKYNSVNTGRSCTSTSSPILLETSYDQNGHTEQEDIEKEKVSSKAPGHKLEPEQEKPVNRSAEAAPGVEDKLGMVERANITGAEPGPTLQTGGLRKKTRMERLSSLSPLSTLSSFFPSLISPPSADSLSHPAHRKPATQDSPLHKNSSLVSAKLPATGTFSLAGDSHKSHERNKSEPRNAPSTMRLLQKQAPPLPPQYAPPPLPSSVSTPPPDSPFQFTETQPSPKPSKIQPPSAEAHRRRSSSLHNGGYMSPQNQSGLLPRHISPSPEPRARSSSAHPPSTRLDPTAATRNVSGPAATASSRPTSSNGSQSPTRENERRGRIRRSWFPGSRSRSNSQDIRGAPSSAAWILDESKSDYNTSFLANGDKVPELWAESGTVLVYLHPKGSGLGPSFKVPSFVIDTSFGFADLLAAEVSSPTSSGRSRGQSFSGRESLSANDAQWPMQSPPASPSGGAGDQRLYLPVAMNGASQCGSAPQPDLERLIAIRNLFAFLTGQPLVGTKAQPTPFSAFMRISGLLAEFQFTNFDGSTFGEAVEMSFGFYIEQMALADVRHSREKTLESLILGENMRSWELYSEAFAHAVGKYAALRDLNSPLWDQMNPRTKQRLERAHLDLLNRQNSVNSRLESFEFPSLFSGIANSTSHAEYKNVKFGTWRKSFNRMRQFTLSYYKASFGSWPPKARSKKNPFSESGLNRQVLKILYVDFCSLYDLLVDRESITPRVIDQSADDIETDDANPHISALRKALTEYDHSSPPVLPPIPCDVPKLPDMKSIKENFYSLPQKEQTRLERNLQEHEFLLILNKSYDFETFKLKSSFLGAFKELELKEAKGKSVSEMADQRLGYWMFLYVVIQSLPMLVVDAPDLKFTDGVEYFLCQPPKGAAPWVEHADLRKKWYEVAGGAGYVELSADAVEFSIEGIYHRSHCWLAAKRWEANGHAPPPLEEPPLSPLQPPSGVFADMDPGAPASPGRSESPPSAVSPQLALRPRTNSPGNRRSAYRSSIALGLEEVRMPNYPPDGRSSRIFSARDSTIGSRPASSIMMNRSMSSGNLPGMLNTPDSRSTSRQEVQGSTFDDILKDVDSKPKKKRSIFFG